MRRRFSFVTALCLIAFTARSRGAEAPAAPGSGGLMWTLRGHDDGVLAVSFSPDGTRLVSASADRTARVWDLATGKQLLLLNGHTAAVLNVQYSGDGKRIITGSADGTARVWDAGAGDLIAILEGHRPHVHCVAISFDGRVAATGSCDRTARAWDVDAERELANLTFRTEVHAVALSADGKTMAGSCGARVEGREPGPLPDGKNCELKVCDVAGGQAKRSIVPRHFAEFIALSPDGTRLLTAATSTTFVTPSSRTTVSTYDLRADDRVTSYLVGGRAESFAADRDLAHVLSGDRTRIGYYALTTESVTESQKELTTFQSGEPLAHGLALSPDGKLAAAASGGAGSPYGKSWQPARNPQVVVWRLSHPPLKTITASFPADDKTRQTFVDPDGARAVILLRQSKARMIDLTNGNLLTKFEHGLPIEPGRDYHEFTYTFCAFSPDRTLIAMNRATGFVVADVATGKPVLDWESNPRIRVHGLAFTPDGKGLVVGCDRVSATSKPAIPWAEGAVPPRLFDLASGQEVLNRFTPAPDVKGDGVSPECVACSHDGRWVVTASLGSTGHRSQAVIWDAKTGRELRRLRSQAYDVRELVLSRTGLVLVRNPHMVFVWDGETGAPLATLDQMTTWVTSAAFTAEGDAVVALWGDSPATSADGKRAGLWDPRTGKLLRSIDAKATGIDWRNQPKLAPSPGGGWNVVIREDHGVTVAPLTFK